MSVSIVIPVFNEERHIRACLDAIARQTATPLEVIVVDNNCTDSTVEIAKSYPFVRVVNEKNQGRGYARTKGFHEARGEIIGRIDADSEIAVDWVERVQAAFAGDDKLMGITGLGSTSFLPFVEHYKTTLLSRGYFWYVHAGFRTVTMWGANMAVRKNAWDAVADKVCNDDAQVHEDQDISLCMSAEGCKIVQDNELLIIADGQAFMGVRKAFHYRKLYQLTRKRHARTLHVLRDQRTMISQIVESLLGFLVVYVLGGLIILLHTLLLPFAIFFKKR